jgi:predicted ATPase
VRDAVEVEALEPVRLKGKSEPVPAYRLVSVHELTARPERTPMVARERELRGLQDAFERAAHDHSCQLFTILGSAGVGKSRLAAEFLTGLDARVVRGRCLSYGDGITYWPVVEVIKQLDTLPKDSAAACAITSLLGQSEASVSAEQIAWAFRKLLEEQAEERPLICVFDDLHWGEETFLDLVEHVADLARGVPLLLLCMARPELLERRPGWGGGKWNSTTVLLEPLDADETQQLLEALGGVEDTLDERIRQAAEGNPLFLEEMVALVRESGGREITVPPTIHALLSARLDQLDPRERSVLERGAVEGRLFHRSAVEALSDGDLQLPAHLVALVRKELIRPDKPQLPAEDAFRFRHLLIRDAAYDALPKATRAELHERFASWLVERGADLVELDEILGHHLEHAARYKAELGRADPGLAEKAGRLLTKAGARAQARGDMPAAASLLRRAADLLPDTDPERADLLLALGTALSQAGKLDEADAVLDQAVQAAHEAGNPRLEQQALIERLVRRVWSRGAADRAVEELQEAIERAIPLFEAEGDELGLARAYKWLAEVHNARTEGDERVEALEEALLHAQAALDPVEEEEIVNYLAGALLHSAIPADEAIRRCHDLLTRPAASPVARVNATASLAHLHARRRNFEEAGRLIASAKRTAEEFGLLWSEARLAEAAGWVLLLEGDAAGAERELARGCDLMAAMGERGRRGTMTLWLAEAVYAQERLDEAWKLARLAEELREDPSVAGSVRAKILARRGELSEALTLASRAAASARRWRALYTYWLLDAGEVFKLAGNEDEAARAFEDARHIYEQSGNLVLAERARAGLAGIRGPTTA